MKTRSCMKLHEDTPSIHALHVSQDLALGLHLDPLPSDTVNMATSDSWTTIESDPGVFTELIERIGVKGAEVQELYAVEGSMLRELEPVYGLIFLFKWEATLKSVKPATEEDAPVYFAQQIINNACATQAMLSILLNQPDTELEIGEQLKQLRTFTQDFPADMRGIAIGNADGIRQAHNSFAPPEAALSDNETRTAGGDDELYHFISFIHAAGSVWELDGLQAGPIRCCDCPHSEWLDRAAEVINARIALYAAKEIRFNLMALVKDQRLLLQERLSQLDAQLEAAADDDSKAAQMRERCEVQDALGAREQERQRWHAENLRRKHNYIPLIFNVLQVLAERDELMALVEQAKNKASQAPVNNSTAGI